MRLQLNKTLSLSYWAFMLFSSMLLFPIAALIWLITYPFDRRLVVLHLFTCFWGSVYTWVNPAWRVSIDGRKKIPRGGPCVLVANHLSLLDILVLFRLFKHFKWVSKIENFRVPFIGWNMSLNRYIPLRRGDRESVRQMFEMCAEAVKAGSSVMMFPEGTRSRDGQLKTFKPGAFELAKQTRAPIVPIVIEGTAHALPKHGFVLRGRHTIRLTVKDPIPYASFADDSVEELTAGIHQRFVGWLGDVGARAGLRDPAEQAFSSGR